VSATDILKAECNRYVNGHCSTARCVKRGMAATGITFPLTDYAVSTCEHHEAVCEINRLRELVHTHVEKAGPMTEDAERWRDALKRIAEGDWPRPHATIYRGDGKQSKHDLCPHGRRIHDDCDECVSAFAQSVLNPIN
jgi:hypothetical protein